MADQKLTDEQLQALTNQLNTDPTYLALVDEWRRNGSHLFAPSGSTGYGKIAKYVSEHYPVPSDDDWKLSKGGKLETHKKSFWDKHGEWLIPALLMGGVVAAPYIGGALGISGGGAGAGAGGGTAAAGTQVAVDGTVIGGAGGGTSLGALGTTAATTGGATAAGTTAGATAAGTAAGTTAATATPIAGGIGGAVPAVSVAGAAPASTSLWGSILSSPITGPAISAGANIAGAKIAANSNDKAAQIAAKAAEDALQWQKEQYAIRQQQLAPSIGVGNAAEMRLGELMGLQAPPGGYKAPTPPIAHNIPPGVQVLGQGLPAPQTGPTAGSNNGLVKMTHPQYGTRLVPQSEVARLQQAGATVVS